MSLINNLKYSFNKRVAFYRQMKRWAKYGDETRFHFQDSNISIGEFTYGIPDITVYDSGTKLSVGKYCSLAKDVKILLGGGHPVTAASQYPFDKHRDAFPNAVAYVPDKKYDVKIGNDVWIGRGVIVLAGVTIGDGAIIGAGAVVSKDIPPYAVAVGNPIQIIRYRTTNENIEKLLKIKWWNFSLDKINTLRPFMDNVNQFISECYKIKWGGRDCSAPCLSIVIVSYNTRDITDACIKSVYDASWRDEFEIIVVDNNSSDGSVEMIREKYPNVKLITNPDNRFFAIANNQGAKIAKGRYLLLLNSDTLVYGENLQKMIDFFDRQPNDVICIGPKILDKNKGIQSYGRPKYGLTEHFIQQMALHKFFPILRKLWKTLPTSPYITHEVGWVSGSCMMIPRHLYEKVGGLNEKLEFYGEEPEFGYRTQKLGYKTIYYHEAEIVHLGGMSTKKVKGIKDLETNLRQYDCLVRLTNGYSDAIKITRLTILSCKIKWLLTPKNREIFCSNVKHERKVVKFLQNRQKGMDFKTAFSCIYES